MTTIYDFGANVGSNIKYYLLKADTVVAVEANARLAKEVEFLHARDVEMGRLVVVNRAVTTATEATKGFATFHQYRGEKEMGHVWSSLVRPAQRPEDYVEVRTPLTCAAELFATYGPPHFVKIDLEHHDFAVLQDIVAGGVLPPYLSVEAHDPRVLGLLLLEGQFCGFKLVRGKNVHRDFADVQISTPQGPQRHSFPQHSAGPFGDDIPGEWLDRSSLVQHYGHFGPGWIDIHATTTQVGRPVARSRDSMSNRVREEGGARELAALSVRAAARAVVAATKGLRSANSLV